jgi:hypothetical protein
MAWILAFALIMMVILIIRMVITILEKNKSTSSSKQPTE